MQFLDQAKLFVGDKVIPDAVAELELDHTGYVVCQNPSSYVVEDTGEDVEVIVVEVEVQFDVPGNVEYAVEVAAAAELYAVAMGDEAVTVTVAVGPSRVLGCNSHDRCKRVDTRWYYFR
jgi:hypothetical protein